MKERWDSLSLTVQTAGPFDNSSHPPLNVRYIDEGSIVVPGMSGKSCVLGRFNMISYYLDYQILMHTF